MPYTLSRPAEGISLNAGMKEYLHDEQGNVKKFETREELQEFLDANGFTEDSLIQVEYEFTDRELSILFQFARTGMADADCYDEIRERFGFTDDEMKLTQERLLEHLERNDL